MELRLEHWIDRAGARRARLWVRVSDHALEACVGALTMNEEQWDVVKAVLQPHVKFDPKEIDEEF